MFDNEKINCDKQIKCQYNNTNNKCSKKVLETKKTYSNENSPQPSSQANTYDLCEPTYNTNNVSEVNKLKNFSLTNITNTKCTFKNNTNNEPKFIFIEGIGTNGGSDTIANENDTELIEDTGLYIDQDTDRDGIPYVETTYTGKNPSQKALLIVGLVVLWVLTFFRLFKEDNSGIILKPFPLKWGGAVLGNWIQPNEPLNRLNRLIIILFYIIFVALTFIGFMIKKDRLIIMNIVLLLFNLFPISYNITNRTITNIFEQL